MVKGDDHSNSSTCPVACILDVIGDRWTLLVVRGLMFLGLHEYKELLAQPEGISTNILVDRLKKLKKWGVIDMVNHPENKTRKLYYLTDKGKALMPMMLEMVKWAATYMPDQVDIPPEKQRAMENGPTRMMEITLKQLADWEAIYLKR